MVEVGVKELKNNLSRYLTRVRRGERIRVTMRGRHVADLLPAETGNGDWGEWRKRWRAAVRASAGIAPYLPPGAEYVESFRAAGARKLDELERRGHG